MHRAPKITRLGATAAAPLLLALALASCGGSSGSSTTTSTQAAAATAPPATTTPSKPNTTTPSTPTATTPAQKAVQSRLQALRACLIANGIKLPAPGSGLIGKLPPGVSASQYRAALRKCAPNVAGTGTPGVTTSKIGRGRFRKALTAFAACMRAHGINLPPPSAAATGPLFNTKGLDTTSSAFKAAVASCRSVLKAAVPTG